MKTENVMKMVMCMNKLKTLKDLEKSDTKVSGRELRKEAIGWIKKCDELLITPAQLMYEINLKDYFPYAVNDKIHLTLDNSVSNFKSRVLEIKTWIKYFFNITEKDLEDLK